jgi:hypothetical protein
VIAEMALGTADIPNLRAVAAPVALALCTTWAVLPTGRVTRDYTLALLQNVAPQLDRRNLIEGFEGQHEPSWPTLPIWPHLNRPISNGKSYADLYGSRMAW